jgi:hypothetical protein
LSRKGPKSRTLVRSVRAATAKAKARPGLITSRDLDPKDLEKNREKDRERLNPGVQSVRIKDSLPADLVDHIRRLVRPNPVVDNDMESAS